MNTTAFLNSFLVFMIKALIAIIMKTIYTIEMMILLVDEEVFSNLVFPELPPLISFGYVMLANSVRLNTAKVER